jgi:hypothetical protein
VAHAIGERNDDAILTAMEGADRVICAWGNGIPGLADAMDERTRQVCGMMADIGKKTYALGETVGGFPRHPLYMPAETEPAPINLYPERVPASAAPARPRGRRRRQRATASPAESEDAAGAGATQGIPHPEDRAAATRLAEEMGAMSTATHAATGVAEAAAASLRESMREGFARLRAGAGDSRDGMARPFMTVPQAAEAMAAARQDYGPHTVAENAARAVGARAGQVPGDDQ